MFDHCTILGDSLAQGITWHEKYCSTLVVRGISARSFDKLLHRDMDDKPYINDDVLISLGSNNPDDPDLEEHLVSIRSYITNSKVTWLNISNSNRASKIIIKIAKEFGDTVLESKPYVGNDGIHPTIDGYKEIAKQWEDLSK